MAASGKWRPEWTALLGTIPDAQLAARLGLFGTTVRFHRVKLGIKPCGKKTRTVKCGTCGNPVRRRRAGGDIACKPCQKKRELAGKAKWRAANRVHIRRYDRRWFEDHREERLKSYAEWEKANPERRKAIDRRWRKKVAKLTEETLASIPCLDCGENHSFENRARVIRRMLPATVWEIRDARPCFWGPPSDVNCTGATTIYRDLRQVGAVRAGSTFYLPAEAREAA